MTQRAWTDGSKGSRAERLADLLESAIVDAASQGSTRLGTKAELQERYGVAPATLNEALRLLHGRDLVEVRPGPGGGVFTKSPAPLARLGHRLLTVRGDSVTIAQLLRVRDALEPLVMTDAAASRTGTDNAAFRGYLLEMAALREDTRAFFRVHWALHRRIAETSDNAVLRVLYTSLTELLEEALDASVAERTLDMDELLAVHDRILTALEVGDVSAVQQAAEDHNLLTTKVARLDRRATFQSVRQHHA
jgi:GntR family transcriptional regulator, transcriptional repressor for pyruvate dehydrogenase complex